MRLLSIATATTLVLLSAGCKREPAAADVNAPASIDNTGASVPVSVNPALGSADFANAIAGGGKFEIDSAALASTKATSTDLKSLAAMISTDHKKAGEDLKAAAAASNPSFTPLASLNAKQKADLEALKAAGSAEFDGLYVAQQIAAHQEAVGILTSYAAGGASPALKDFASKVLPTVQSHLDKLNALPR